MGSSSSKPQPYPPAYPPPRPMQPNPYMNGCRSPYGHGGGYYGGMVTEMSKKEILECYRKLMRVKYNVFKNDVKSQKILQKKIQEEIKNQQKGDDVELLIKKWNNVAEIMNKSVIQLETLDNGKYKAHIRPEQLNNNAPFRNEDGSCMDKEK
ncbi:hypothetical protein SNEBB_000799 [Seison nebaliae]|nr:hypothetical protein SNEBB_000799 [Seison nebaliae]